MGKFLHGGAGFAFLRHDKKWLSEMVRHQVHSLGPVSTWDSMSTARQRVLAAGGHQNRWKINGEEVLPSTDPQASVAGTSVSVPVQEKYQVS